MPLPWMQSRTRVRAQPSAARKQWSMRATFIRHGQSTGNAGIPAHDLALLELAELGWTQSREVAASWTGMPSLIVTSPYLRTQQTAAATIERLRDVAVEVWPIQEFTYLQPSRWDGTRSSERIPVIERYWNEADPEYCDGEGRKLRDIAEPSEGGFGSIGGHAGGCLGVRLQPWAVHPGRPVVGHRRRLDRSGEDAEVWGKGSPAIANGELVELSLDGGVRRYLLARVSIA